MRNGKRYTAVKQSRLTHGSLSANTMQPRRPCTKLLSCYVTSCARVLAFKFYFWLIGKLYRMNLGPGECVRLSVTGGGASSVKLV